MRSICIVGLDGYSLLAGNRNETRVGGETIQHVLLARAWRDLGLDVSMIVHEHGQPRDATIDGVRTLAAFAHGAGVPVLRFLHPRVTGLLAALRRADADVYYQSPAGAWTGITAWFCRRHRKRFVFRLASDVNCVPGQQLIRYRRDRQLYEYGLRRADLIAAQTQHQRRLLRTHYGLASAVVNMAVESPLPDSKPRDIDVLWISNLRAVKRPELALEMARRLPDVRFTIAGGPMPGAQTCYRETMAAASQLRNVTWLGAVPYAESTHLFARARVFLNTSSVEGFPNTFLQAWAHGVPVVSFFDPDDLIANRGLGYAVQSLEEMVEALRRLLGDERQASDFGNAARACATSDYSSATIARRYIDLLDVSRLAPVTGDRGLA